MILTDQEMSQVRRSIEAQAGLDEELLRRCSHLVHMGAFDEAVRSAFVLLEERLRKAVNQEGLTGTQLANHAFNAIDGPLSKHLGRTQSEREGLRELYSGAFKLFRNPTAHGVVGYDAVEGKAIIGLVNLMLKILKRVEELPAPDIFPGNVERALSKFEGAAGPGAASRLRIFLGRCLKMGIEPRPSTKQWIPFRRYALIRYEHWDKPKPHHLTIFYLLAEDQQQGLFFPVNQYYANVIGLDVDQVIEELKELGFHPAGKYRDPRIDLRLHNDQAFFEGLFDLVTRTAENLEETLQQSD